jgi:hypothetical protein
MNFRVAEFPSDVLSVKRFRVLFPDNFDRSDSIVDGHTSNNFFYPFGPGDPPHLDQLTELICDERTVAAGAFYRCYLDRDPDILDQEELDCVAKAKTRLEQNYQRFKLADSPQTARLLMKSIEEQGEVQAHEAQAKGLSL